MAWTISLVLGVAAGALAAEPPPGPPRLVHTPPSYASAGVDMPVLVKVEGAPSKALRVTVSYRNQGARDFASVGLVAAADGGFHGVVPGTAVRGLKLYYVVEVSARARSGFVMALGSREAPIAVTVRDAEPVAGLSLAVKLLVAVLPIGLAAVFVGYRDRRRRRHVLDQIFWVRTLLPLTYLQSEALSARVTDLMREPLDHPVSGLGYFPRELILRKLHAVRRIDLGALLKARDHCLGPGYELAVAPPVRRQGPLGVVKARTAVAAR